MLVSDPSLQDRIVIINEGVSNRTNIDGSLTQTAIIFPNFSFSRISFTFSLSNQGISAIVSASSLTKSLVLNVLILPGEILLSFCRINTINFSNISAFVRFLMEAIVIVIVNLFVLIYLFKKKYKNYIIKI